MLILRVAPTLLTQERFQLDFFVDGSTWEGLFDRIEVWRSRSTALGPYIPMHYDSWFPARLPHGNLTAIPPAPAQAARTLRVPCTAGSTRSRCGSLTSRA